MALPGGLLRPVPPVDTLFIPDDHTFASEIHPLFACGTTPQDRGVNKVEHIACCNVRHSFGEVFGADQGLEKRSERAGGASGLIVSGGGDRRRRAAAMTSAGFVSSSKMTSFKSFIRLILLLILSISSSEIVTLRVIVMGMVVISVVSW